MSTGTKKKKKSSKPKQQDETVAIHARSEDDKHHVVGIGNLRVLIVPEGKFWFAQGLEIDYAAQGDSIDEAKKNFEHGLGATIDLHLRMYGDFTKLLKFAPSESLREAARNRDSIKLYSQVSVHEVTRTEEPLPFGGIDYYLLQGEVA